MPRNKLTGRIGPAVNGICQTHSDSAARGISDAAALETRNANEIMDIVRYITGPLMLDEL